MPIPNIDYAAGQDTMEQVFNKLNDAIDEINFLSATVAFLEPIIVPIGGVVPYFASTVAPNANFRLCNGDAISRATYSALFALMGTNYGVGDGSTTFNLPNLKGRVPAGYDPGDSDYNALTSAKIGGEKTHVLAITEVPTSVRTGGHSTNFTENGLGTGNAFMDTAPGAGAAFENRSPYITTNFIIRII